MGGEVTAPRIVIVRDLIALADAAARWRDERGQWLADDAHPTERKLFEVACQLRADLVSDPSNRCAHGGPHFKKRKWREE